MNILVRHAHGSWYGWAGTHQEPVTPDQGPLRPAPRRTWNRPESVAEHADAWEL